VVTVNDVLDGHVALDIQCLDRVYLNAYAAEAGNRQVERDWTDLVAAAIRCDGSLNLIRVGCHCGRVEMDH
jgi:hypothetical protein